MRISVCLPVYNAETTIAEAVRSVLSQTFTDLELLIVDDGATDHTFDSDNDGLWKDERIILIRDGKHLGLATRLNQMISLAHGEYIARMDADDIMIPTRLEKQVAFMQENPEVDVVSCAAIIIDEHREKVGVRNEKLMHPTVMGRTEWFRQNPYNEAYSGVEDYELWLRVKDHANIAHISEPLMYYREHTCYNIKKVWQERSLGIKMIWNERHLYGSLRRAVWQIGNNLCVMLAVPIIHVLHLDHWIISKRNTNVVN